jgi:hypothetical protein
MLKPHEIFANMSPETAIQILTFLTEKEKALYKATVESIASNRKLRPIFIDRKPKLERFAWIKENLGKKQSEAIAAHLLQIWLVGAQSKLLCDFLDGLGIAHDENGTIDNLPPAPSKEDLERTISGLLSTHDTGVVLVYLHAFQALDENGWSTLGELLAEDPRLKLGA